MCEVLSSSPQHQYHHFQGLQEYCCFMGWKSLELKIKPAKILNSGIFTIALSYFCWGLGKGLETQERFCGDRTKGKTLSRLNRWRSCFLSLTHSGDSFGGRWRHRQNPLPLTAWAESSHGVEGQPVVLCSLRQMPTYILILPVSMDNSISTRLCRSPQQGQRVDLFLWGWLRWDSW